MSKDPDATATAPVGADVSQAGEVQGGRGAAWLFAPGQLLAGRYRIQRFIARGGMGEVYEALDEQIRARVAIKALLPGGDPVKREARLKRELVLARKITHRNVCRVFDVDHEVAAAGARVTVPFVTMELLHGDTLAAHLAAHGPLALEAATPIIEQLVAGLEAAHAAGVIHRDFKPHNVILVPDAGAPRVVITDFGLARAIADDRGAVTTTDFAGTPAYMAPEQVLDQAPTEATDVYALGVTLFEMVTGSRPFEGASPFSVAMQRVRGDAPRAATRTPALDPRWDAAIARCLAREPADRFRRAGEVLEALRGRVPVAVVSSRPRRWPRRALLAALAALVVVATGAAALVVRPWARVGAPAAPTLSTHGVFADGEVAMLMTLGARREAEVFEVLPVPDGDTIIAGRTASPLELGASGVVVDEGSGYWTGFVARLAPDGRPRWVRVLESEGDTSVHAIALLADQVVVAGVRRGGLDLGAARLIAAPREQDDCFVAAIAASDGDGRWVHACDADVGRATSLATDGSHVYVAGEQSPDAAVGATATLGLYVSSYAADGTHRWTTTADEQQGYVQAPSLASRDGRVVVGANLSGRVRLGGFELDSHGVATGLLAELDPATGAPRWMRTIPGSHPVGISGIGLLPDGRLALAGGFHDRIELVAGEPRQARGGADVYVAVLDRDGTATRAWYGGSSSGDFITDLELAGTEILVSGDADPGFGFERLPALEGPRGIVVRVDADAGPIELRGFGELENTRASAVATTSRGTLLIGGRFRYRLSVGEHRATSPAIDGFVVELRGRGPR